MIASNMIVNNGLLLLITSIFFYFCLNKKTIMKKIFTLLLLLPAFFAAKSQSTSIVISQVYGGGGSTALAGGLPPAYKDDYVELHNVSTSPVTLQDWALFYGSQTGNIGGTTSSRIKLPQNLVIPAGGYYLVQILSADSTGTTTRLPTLGAALPVTADLVVGTPGTPPGAGYVATVSGNPSMSGTNGKIVLANDTTLFNCGKGGPGVAGGINPCPAPTIAKIVDLVGYGKLSDSLTTNFEGWVSQGVLGDTASVGGGKYSLNTRVVAVRKNNGCQDSQNNFADFDTVQYAAPRNSASQVNICLGTSPVKLNGFTTIKVNNSVLISWTTEQEFNNKAFVIQRSENGVVWTDVTTININGNSSSSKSYSANDNTPLNGFNYYRLKQVNTDGSYNLSPVKKVYFSANYKVLITPNPAKDFINVYVAKDNSNTNTTVKVTSMNGQVVRTVNSALSNISISTNGLSKGVYFVKVTDASHVSTQKIAIQ